MSEDGINDEAADRFRTLSIIVPVFNERSTVAEIVRRMRSVELPVEREIVVVDDGSDDGTADVLTQLRDSTVRVLRHHENRGKGAAIRTGLESATGDLVLVQDADLEYDPADYPRLLEPFERRGAEVVYGTRSFSSHTAYSFWFVMGNKAVTLWSNLLFNSYLSDLETGYKVMPLSTWRSLDLQANGFDIEPEITAKLLRAGHRIYEVPISYAARTREEGKKLTWQDGVKAVWTLGRIRLGPRAARRV